MYNLAVRSILLENYVVGIFKYYFLFYIRPLKFMAVLDEFS
jgi:hypothetical protein